MRVRDVGKRRMKKKRKTKTGTGEENQKPENDGSQ